MANHYNHSLAYKLSTPLQKSCLLNLNHDYIKLSVYTMLINIAGDKLTTSVLILNQNQKLQHILNSGQYTRHRTPAQFIYPPTLLETISQLPCLTNF